MELGDIYALGSHRLMCGDATKKEDVLKLVGSEKINLVLTDPPYGMKAQQHDNGVKIGSKGKEYPPIIGDDSSDNARENYYIVSDLCDLLIFWGGQYFTDFLPVSGAWLFWDKKRGKVNFSDGELAWVSKGQRVRKYPFCWNGYIHEGKKILNERVHQTQKPVELHMSILQDFSKEWDVVLDCFAGSGTTLIACEMTGRKCLTMEISPEYCEIICKRFEKLTGIKPVKL